jgi:hypothetical protein
MVAVHHLNGGVTGDRLLNAHRSAAKLAVLPLIPTTMSSQVSIIAILQGRCVLHTPCELAHRRKFSPATIAGVGPNDSCDQRPSDAPCSTRARPTGPASVMTFGPIKAVGSRGS